MFRRRGPAAADEDPLIISPFGSPGPVYAKARKGGPPAMRTLAAAAAALLLCWALWTGRLELHLSPASARAPAVNGSGSSSSKLGSLAAREEAAAAAADTQQQQQQQQQLRQELEPAPPRHKRQLPDGSWAPTLLVYVFSNTDPEYINNLRFFVKFGMAADDGVTYIIVVQETPGEAPPELPPLPPNARYVRHTNECYDWGTIGWVFSTGVANPDDYKFFIFMNSSVRGPFIPPYARGGTRWQDLFFDKLTDHVKLVGPTISCEGSPWQGNAAGEWRINPHVQSYVLATDKVGLDVWLRDGNVFKCWRSMWDVIWHGELGSSLALLNAGFNLDSFMMRYQGVDWLDQANWHCNKRANPYGEHYLDGISLNPFEVLFVKVKERVLQNDWSFAVQAVKYTHWMEAQAAGKPDVASNAYRDNNKPLRAPRLAYLQARGPECFDWQYYLQQNQDLKHYTTKAELWSHFLRGGAYEGRAFRFTCPFEPQPPPK
ncbi:hypothetical protein COHA_010020 [Chlorella ohadii]|uniref:Uncharacterized protein n=1 Tax=Chlorella ohadii TaxID=2649997 RepID=A0AAD5H1P3_9CHLO|nr:hypothetical protein COHA_010020 [Chlorella ohadii]